MRKREGRASMKRWPRILLLASGTSLLAAAIAWWHWPRLWFALEPCRIEVDEQGRPVHRGRYPSDFSVNTFTDDVSSGTVADLYDAASHRLDALRGPNIRRTYHWLDRIGFPRVSSVVQFPAGYVEVMAYQANDSDGVDVRISSGLFRASEGCTLRELPNNRLPAGTLRGR